MKTLIKHVRVVIALFVISLLVSSTLGGERGPGQYAGVVIFDRWDTCYIYSGIYLMYIADNKKEPLRKYAGQSIVVDAKKVFQPINPGDGLITEFEFVGDALPGEHPPKVDGLKLSAFPLFEPPDRTRFALEIENQSDRTIEVESDAIAPTLLGEENKQDGGFSPSDGRSIARITRFSLKPEGEGVPSPPSPKRFRAALRDSFSITVEKAKSVPISFELKSGQKRRFMVSLKMSAGEYDFLFGYGGGVHEAKGLASNIISFSVDGKRRATLLTAKVQVAKPTNRSDFSFVNRFVHTSITELFLSDFPIL